MPPRPPLTSLVIHTWKEHGKPNPVAAEQVSAQSAHHRISHSISVDAALSAQRAAVFDDDDAPSARHHAFGTIGRSSTFDDAAVLGAQVAAAAKRSTVAASTAMATSRSFDEALHVHRSVDVIPSVPRRACPEDEFSSPALRTSMEVGDGQEQAAHHGCSNATDVLPRRPYAELPCGKNVVAAPQGAVKLNGAFGGDVRFLSRTAQKTPLITQKSDAPSRRVRAGRVVTNRGVAGMRTGELWMEARLPTRNNCADTGLSVITKGYSAVN